MLTRTIPSTNEPLPAIGLGTWQTFDVSDKSRYPQLTEVLRAMHAAGGTLIDSSPMYGRAETVIGDLTAPMEQAGDFFYATKVWTTGSKNGIRQMEDSMEKMRRPVIDLMQIHNLTDWETHLPTLRRWKEEGRIRYLGVTHYRDEYHEALMRVLRQEPLDFVQFNYSILSRYAENRMLPFAADRGIATIINRPFGEGAHFKKIAGKALPPWAVEWGIYSWGDYFLRYILAHPAVTCVIPATSNPHHALENLAAGQGPIPDADGLKKMVEYVER